MVDASAPAHQACAGPRSASGSPTSEGCAGDLLKRVGEDAEGGGVLLGGGFFVWWGGVGGDAVQYAASRGSARN